MVELCKKISESKAFTNFILCVIGAAAVVVGMQTYKGFELEHRAVLDTLDAVILGIFIFEVVIKIVAQGGNRKTISRMRGTFLIFQSWRCACYRFSQMTFSPCYA